MLRLRHTLRDQRGTTLVETIVSLFLVTIAVAVAASSGLNSMSVQLTSERLATYSTATQAIMAKARQADYSDLGFYADDAEAETGAVTLPVVDDLGAALAEQAIVLGPSRPAATSSFDVAPVETFEADGVTYRVQTWVTAVPAAPGDDVSRARRVVVQGEWAMTPDASQLDGTCAGKNVRCSVQMIVRTASGSDIDPASGHSAADSSSCSSVTPNICEAYVRSGRVLDGATMVTDADTARQSAPVDLYLRTSTVATSVVATWSYQVASGPTVVAQDKSVSLTSLDGGTRWSGDVPADDGTPKGTIRPGKVNVTFTAVVPGGTVTSTVPAFWTVSRNTGSEIDHVTATLADPADSAWCTPDGSGPPIRVTTTGGSVGMSTTTPTTAGADRAWATFAVRQPDGTTLSRMVAATPVTVSPVTRDLAGTLVQVSTDTTWELQAPGSRSCATSAAASLVLARAVDGSTTTMPLRLAAPADPAPEPEPEPEPEPTPEPTPTVPPAPPAPAAPAGLRVTATTSTSVTVSWSAVDGATSYATNPAGAVSGTSATITASPGSTIAVSVRATNAGGDSPWSSTVQAVLKPAAPAGLKVTNIRGLTVSLQWTAAPGATSYTLSGVSGAKISGTTATGTFSVGTATVVTVNAVGPGGTTTGSSTQVEMPSHSLPVNGVLTPGTGNGLTGINNQRRSALVSPNGRYVAYLQQAGNFVLYDLVAGTAVAWTHNYGPGPTNLNMQGDGNLVLYLGSTPLKSTATTVYANARLNMQDDGNLVLYSSTGTALWALSRGASNPGAGATFMVTY